VAACIVAAGYRWRAVAASSGQPAGGMAQPWHRRIWQAKCGGGESLGAGVKMAEKRSAGAQRSNLASGISALWPRLAAWPAHLGISASAKIGLSSIIVAALAVIGAGAGSAVRQHRGW